MPAATEVSRLRLDRFVSQGTGLSRSRVKALLSQQRVQVDAVVVRDPAFSVTPAHEVVVDGTVLGWPRHYYVMLHKPLGVVCSTSDPIHTPVHRLIETPWADRLHAAGRLDADTTGLVLLTSDGDWSHRLTSPRHHCAKRYLVRLSHALDATLIARFAEGIVLNDDPRPTLAATLESIAPIEAADTHWARVTLSEGRYHQVRRMFAACGNHVEALHRERIGALVLDVSLTPGQWRELSADEITGVFNG